MNLSVGEIAYTSGISDIYPANIPVASVIQVNDNNKRPFQDVKVKIFDRDFTNIKEVDLKLVRLAKELTAHLVTNDFNLTKVANLQGVRVLNVNQLANSLRPVILPGEKMKIKVSKSGKDEKQGVGYLDDGTMVVIDNGKKHISEFVDIVITSVIQTPTGTMIFSKVGDLHD